MTCSSRNGSNGRATWKESVPICAKGGVVPLERWLSSQGVANIQTVNRSIEAAKPWYQLYGAKLATELAA